MQVAFSPNTHYIFTVGAHRKAALVTLQRPPTAIYCPSVQSLPLPKQSPNRVEGYGGISLQCLQCLTVLPEHRRTSPCICHSCKHADPLAGAIHEALHSVNSNLEKYVRQPCQELIIESGCCQKAVAEYNLFVLDRL